MDSDLVWDKVEKKIEERKKLFEKQEEEIKKAKKSQEEEKTKKSQEKVNSSNEVESNFLEKLKKYPFEHNAYYNATNKIPEYKALYDKLLSLKIVHRAYKKYKYKDLIDYLKNDSNKTLFDIYKKLSDYKNKKDIKNEVNAFLNKLKQI